MDSDFAFDSLGRVELLLRLERSFDVALPDALLNSADTPRDLLRAVLRGQHRKLDVLLPEVERIDAVLQESTSVPERAETLIDVLEWHLQLHPDRTHIRLYDPHGESEEDGEDRGECEDVTISFRQLKAGAMRVAAGLQNLDLQPQEAVVLMLPTCEAYFYCFFGVLYAGGIPCPIYPPGRISQIEEHLNRHVSIVQNAAAGIMLTQAEALPFAGLLRSRVRSLRHVVTAEAVQQAGEAPVLPKLHGADIAFLQYTSGSTGTPKGVVLTHANLLANVRAMGEAVEASSSDVFVSWLPLYHDMGLIGAWFGSLYHAAQLVIMSPLSFIARPQRWLEAIHRYRGTLSASPNFGYEHCIRLVDDETRQQLDLSSWRCAFNGAEPVSPQTLSAFCERFAPCGFDPNAMMPVYGLAENSVGLAFPPLRRGAKVELIDRERFSRTGQAVLCLPEEKGDRKTLEVVACGRVVPRHQLRVVDESDRELPDRQEGRIQFKGPSATSGYYRNPEQTAALFHGDWLETGDLGYISAGELYVTGRQKDLIILAGRNIHPAALESAVAELEGIRKGGVVAFGCRSPERGTERFILVAETRIKDEMRRAKLSTDITQLAVDLLGRPVDEVVLVAPNQVLKTSSGKVRRSACKTLYEEGNLNRASDGRWLQWLRIGWGELTGRMDRFRRRGLDYAFAGYGRGIYALLLCLVTPALLVLPGIPLRWCLIRQATRLLGWLTGTSVRVEGLENLPSQEQSCVFVCNHASYLDGYALVGYLPRCVRFVAKGELRQKKLLVYLLRKIGTEFVTRFDSDQGCADTARLARQARGDTPLFFFPEGTFTRVPGLRAFHLGAFTTACQQQLSVIPLAIRGTRSMLRADSWFPRRGHIVISVGKPISSEKVAGDDSWQKALALRDQTRAEVLRLSGEADLDSETAIKKES